MIDMAELMLVNNNYVLKQECGANCADDLLFERQAHKPPIYLSTVDIALKSGVNLNECLRFI